MKISEIKPQVYEMAARAEERIRSRFAQIDAVAEENTRRVMEAFQDNRVSDSCFAGTTGYGYDDRGREVLDQVAAQVRALVDGMAACPFKFNVGGLGGAAEGGHQQLPVRLVRIADIVNRSFQR